MNCSGLSEAGSSSARTLAAVLRPSSVQKSQTRSGCPSAIPSNVHEWKLRCRSFCQPGRSVFTHSGSVGVLLRTSTVDGVR